MALQVRTRYAECGEMDSEIDIAYQTVGAGSRDLVVLSPVLITIDSVKAEPSMDRFHRRLASFSRVIRLDHRGTGLSSHVPSMDRAGGPQYWAEDVLAVMEAAGSEQAVVLASGLAASTGLFLAANHPEKVSGLVIVNGTARFRRAPDYPVGAEESLVTPLTTVAMDPDAVGLGFDALELLAPTVSNEEVFRTWWDEAGNRAASPSMARAITQLAAGIDVRDFLSRITTPTLIMHRAGCGFLGPGHGRYLAEHIAQSRYMELPGTDMLYWVGDTAPLLEEIEEFVTGERSGVEGDRTLAVLLFTDIVSSTQRAAAMGDLRWRDLLDSHDNLVRHHLRRFGGREINTTGDGFVAVFTVPGKAIDCAKAIIDAVHSLGIEVRAGIHVGEVELRGEDVAGMAVHIGARVAAHAEPNEILVSSTVQQILAGSNRVFREHGTYDLKGVPGRWQLFSV